MRPAPEYLPVAEFGQVLGLRLGQEDDVGPAINCAAWRSGPRAIASCCVGDAEALTVADFEELLSDFLIDAVQMQGVDGEAALVGLPRGGEDAYAELGGWRSLLVGGLELVALFRELAGAAEARLSALFSLMDLLDFLDAV